MSSRPNQEGFILVSLGLMIFILTTGLLLVSYEVVRSKLASQRIKLETERICASVSAEPFHQSSAWEKFNTLVSALDAHQVGFQITAANLVIPTTPDGYCESECPTPYAPSLPENSEIFHYFSSFENYPGNVPAALRADRQGAGSKVLCELKGIINSGATDFVSQVFPVRHEVQARTMWAQAIRNGKTSLNFVIDPWISNFDSDARFGFDSYTPSFREDYDPFFNKSFDEPSPSAAMKRRCSNPPVLIRNKILSTLIELASRHGQSMTSTQLLTTGGPSMHPQDLRARNLPVLDAQNSCYRLYGGISNAVLKRSVPENLQNEDFETPGLFFKNTKLWDHWSPSDARLSPGEFGSLLGVSEAQASLKDQLDGLGQSSLPIIFLHTLPPASERSAIQQNFSARPKIVLYLPTTRADAENGNVEIVRNIFGLDRPGNQLILMSPLQEKFSGTNPEYPNLLQLSGGDEAHVFTLYWRYLLETPYLEPIIDEDVSQLARAIFTHGILRPEVQF